MIKGAEPITSKDFNKGLVTRSDFLKGDMDASPNTMDVQWNFDASIRKRFGATSVNAIAIGSTAIAGFTVDSNATLTTSLRAFWKFDEASGTRFDTFGTTNLTDGDNDINSITGILNGAANLISAGSTYLFTTNTLSIAGSGNFSISTWVYFNSTAQQTIFAKRGTTLDSNVPLILHCSGANLSTANLLDSSYFNNAGQVNNIVIMSNGAALSTTQAKFGNASAYFVASSSQFASVATRSQFDFSSPPWTMDMWFWVGDTANEYVLFSQVTNASNYVWGRLASGSLTFDSQVGGNVVASFAHGSALLVNSWNHAAFVQNGTVFYSFLNGLGVSQISTANLGNYTGPIEFGRINPVVTTARYMSGYLDEIRASFGRAQWTANFGTGTAEYSNDYGMTDYEYWLYLNTGGSATFRVSSSGITQDGSVASTSFGTLTTATWYNIVAWHSNNSHIGVSVNLSATTAAYTSGVRIGSNRLSVGVIDNAANAQPTLLNARIDESGFWSKVLSAQEKSDLYSNGTANTYSQAGNSGFGWASFDFGASSIRWLTVAAGTGLYASSNRGTTFVVIGTTRTQSYQYLNRSKNVLIATSDSYDVPLYWAGSAGTFASTLAPNSAPAAKFSINYAGFLILLNSQDSNGTLNKRRFNYADENLQLTNAWTTQFDFDSSADDEVTNAFVLYKFLYVSTRYRIFRVAFAGGSPDWISLKVKDWGYVPRTAQIVSLKGGGQVCIGLDWDRRLRMFDGFDDLFISDNVENNNLICDFATNKISYAGSGLQISHATLNPITQEYRLNVAIGAKSTQTTHAIVLNARSLALYPYSNQGWQTMCIAESNNQRALMAVDRSGFCYILDSGNLDNTTAINEAYDSPVLFSQVPEMVSKGKQLNLFFAPVSCGIINYQSRVDLSNQWGTLSPLSNVKGEATITGTENLIKVLRTVDVKETYNTIQFKITSSGNTTNSANPWQLDRIDFLQQGFGIGKGV